MPPPRKPGPLRTRSASKTSASPSRSDAYAARAAQVLAAMGIYEDVVRDSEELGAAQKKIILRALEQQRRLVAEPEPAFRNLESLAYLEQATVQPWNESSGADADEFWRRVAELGLDYRRKDVIREVLKRKRIRDALARSSWTRWMSSRTTGSSLPPRPRSSAAWSRPTRAGADRSPPGPCARARRRSPELVRRAR